MRGLGKGAFGRVYMIKERESQLPLTTEQDILSLKDETSKPVNFRGGKALIVLNSNEINVGLNYRVNSERGHKTEFG